MKTSTKLFAVALIIIPFISWAGFYWYARSVEQINMGFPNEDIIQHVKSIEDIEAIKKLLISEFNSSQEVLNRDVSVFYSYASM